MDRQPFDAWRVAHVRQVESAGRIGERLLAARRARVNGLEEDIGHV